MWLWVRICGPCSWEPSPTLVLPLPHPQASGTRSPGPGEVRLVSAHLPTQGCSPPLGTISVVIRMPAVSEEQRRSKRSVLVLQPGLWAHCHPSSASPAWGWGVSLRA